MIVRPGPESIAADTAPDGVVVHCYSVPDAVLLFVQHLTPGCDLEALAVEAVDTAAEHAGNVCLVAYDGDSGQRLSFTQSILDMLQ